MGFENYISENEAATLAGVSTNTLHRFAEAGYLGVESDSDGLRLFSKREIADVFGITDETLASRIEIERDYQEQESTDSVLFEPSQSGSNSVELNGKDRDSGFKTVSTYSPQQPRQTQDASVNNSIESSDLASKNSATPEPTHSDSKGELLIRLEQDVRRLKSALDLQEKLLDLRESEIDSLKSERDWLRIRIERLEEKGDRDQLLLLSETQVLRQLLTQREHDRRRTPLRAALEWIGLVDPTEYPHSANPLPRAGTIDIAKRQSNRD